MRFRPSASYAFVAVLALGLVGLGTREDRGDGESQRDVLMRGTDISGQVVRADAARVGRSTGLADESSTPAEPDPSTGRPGGRGVDERPAWETYDLELDAVLGLRDVRGAVEEADHDRRVDSADISSRLAHQGPPEPVAAAAETVNPRALPGLSTSPNVEMWRDLVSAYGWPVDEALRVMACESGGNPLARGDGGVSLGLFQINTGWSGPSGPNGWASWLGLAPSDLLDGPTNIASAYRIWSNSGGWGQWSCRP